MPRTFNKKIFLNKLYLLKKQDVEINLLPAM